MRSPRLKTPRGLAWSPKTAGKAKELTRAVQKSELHPVIVEFVLRQLMEQLSSFNAAQRAKDEKQAEAAHAVIRGISEGRGAS